MSAPGRLAAAIVPAIPPVRAVAPPGRTILVSSEPFFGAYVRFGARNPIIREDGNEVLWWGSIPPYVFNPVLAFDVATGSQTAVSLGLSGELLNADLNFGASPDGRFVAFVGPVPVQTECCSDFRREVLLRDRLAGTTTLVSVTPTGQPSMNASPQNPAVSRDGRYVVFESQANDLTPENGSNLGNSYVYLRDLWGGLTTRISPPESVNAGGGRKPKISADGRYVVFQGNSGVWSFDRFSSSAEILARDRFGAVVPTAHSPSISGDGRFVAYDAFSDGIVADDTNGTNDVFVFDRTDRSTRRASLGTGGVQGDRSSFAPSISSDGRFVAFESTATNFAPDTTDANGTQDIFVRDLQLDRTTLVSVSVTGTTPNNSSSAASVSADGTRVAFGSGATDLMPLVDTNSRPDAFLRDLRATNSSPVVTAGGDGSAQVGVEFRRQVSFTDPDTQTWRASVTFGDGASASFDLGTSKSFTLAHTYTALSTYTVEVVVTDSGGASGTDHFKVEVPNQTPAVNAGSDTTLFEGDRLIRTASFSDLDFGPWLVSIDYGDGSPPQQFGVDSNQSFTLDHVYEAGEFDVAVTVADSLHSSATQRFHLTARNVPPTVFIEQPSAYLDTETQLRGSFADPGTTETFTGTIDFGDQAPIATLTLGADRTFTIKHRYLQVGIFEAHVTITDSNHGVSPTTSVGVFVKRRPLVFVPGIIGSLLSAPTGADIQIPNGHGGMVRTAGYTGEVWPHVVSWDPTSTEDFFDILKFTTDGLPYYPDIIATGLLDADGLPVDGTYFRLEPILRAAGYRPEDYRIFPYDWRYSAARASNVQRLDGVIEELMSSTGADSIDIVAHSMGTLLARAYLLTGAERSKVAHAVLLGSLQLGTPDAMAAAAIGDCLPPSPCLLQPSEVQDVLHTLPGAIEFVPSQQYWAEFKGEDPDHAIPFVDLQRRRPAGYFGQRDFLRSHDVSDPVLTAAERFHDADRSWLDAIGSTRVTFEMGIGFCTTGQVVEYSTESANGLPATGVRRIPVEGDGRVVRNANGSAAERRVIYVDGAGHANTLIQDLGLGVALDVLHDRAPASSTATHPCGQIQIHSPADVVVSDSAGRRTGSDGHVFFNDSRAASYGRFGEVKYVDLNAPGSYTADVFGTGVGETSVDVMWTSASALVTLAIYPRVPTTPASRGTFSVNTSANAAGELLWDTDGDGTVDLRVSPRVLSGAAARDLTPPVVTPDPQLDGRTVIGGLRLTWAATDPESGVVSTAAWIDPGTSLARRFGISSLVEFTAGTHSVEFVAEDGAGLASFETRTVTALGLEWTEPLGSGGFEGNAGRSIPVKFTIRAADGTPFVRQIATLEIRDATGRTVVGPIGSGTNPSNGIAVVGNDMYHAGVPTTGLAPGTYELVLRFDASDVTGEVHRTLTLH